MSDEKTIGVKWDLSDFFPEFNGPEMIAMKKEITDGAKLLQHEASQLKDLTKSTADQWEDLLIKTEALESKLYHLYCYVYCLSSADAKNGDYSKETSALKKLISEFHKLDVDFKRVLKETDDTFFNSFINREKLKDVGYQISRLRQRAQKAMPRELEMLAADLNVDGFHSWSRLYDIISGKLEFDMVMPDGKTVKKPISEWRSLMADADREVGRAAFEGGNKAWETIEDTCAAILNSIAGTRFTLYKYRGIEDYLEIPLFQSGITKQTLDAMYEAIEENLYLARDIIRVKANFMGRNGIWWYEREAPLPLENSCKYSWEEGVEMVQNAFSRHYPKYGEYFRKLISNKWVESEARGGKRPGAFCYSTSFRNLERVYMSFNQTLNDITTLAHESGHAFHGSLMHDIRPMARAYPMTLAETASIFSEQIFAQSVLSDASISDKQKLLMLDASLSDAAVYLLDITVRFEFEKQFHDMRQNGEIGVSDIRKMMVAAQKNVMQDVLVDGGEDPMFWASKLHFYKTSVSFYNYPYTFGYLFSSAIYNMFKKQGEAFLPKYEKFLRKSGSASVEDVTWGVFNLSIQDSKFWSDTIQELKKPIDTYKELLTKLKK
ncbi:MAG: M3 family oligoendopeptidase [Desulfobacterales bacterium]